VAAYTPFSLLFPRAEMVVHQGGVGTVHQALRGGRPQLVVPHLGDQYDNAVRVARMGCGATLARGRYRAETVAGVLAGLLDDPVTAVRAAEAAGVVGAEDGAGVAAGLISELVG